MPAVKDSVSWHDAIQTKRSLCDLSGKRCPARGAMLRLLCQSLAVRLSPCRLSFFFFAFFQAPLECYLYLGVSVVRLGLGLG